MIINILIQIKSELDRIGFYDYDMLLNAFIFSYSKDNFKLIKRFIKRVKGFKKIIKTIKTNYDFIYIYLTEQTKKYI